MNIKDSMNAQEVADRLGIAKNTVYELVKRGEINSYRIGRKIRFTPRDVDEYLEGSKRRAPTEERSDPEAPPSEDGGRSGFVISGQDMMLDVLASYLGNKMGRRLVLRSYLGSYDSLINLYRGEVDIASSHLWDGDSGEYNAPYVKRLLPGTPVCLVDLTTRTQGFYVLEGNPKDITTWEDLLRQDVTIINREKGAGSRVLLDEHLRLMGRSGKDIHGYRRESHSHITVATTVARHGADVAVGDGKAINQLDGLDFIPQQEERYQLVFRKDDMDSPMITAMLEILKGSSFRDEFRNMKDYDTRDMGRITYVE